MSDPKKLGNNKCFANIHHFDKDLETGDVHTDEFGEDLIGHYYQLFEAEDEPLSNLVGPYGSDAEAEEAAEKAFKVGDYDY